MQILICGHQNYEWGKPGVSSLIHKIQSYNSSFFPSLDPLAKYAELWIGTHSTLPSYLMSSPTISLKAHLKQHPELLGENAGENGNKEELPYLMKVLSVGKSLSIQAHPDKELAQLLHEKHPQIYKDSNHKPEMAIALTKFEALCNFASFEKIDENLSSYPEFSCIFREEVLLDFRKNKDGEALKSLVLNLFNAQEDSVRSKIQEMVSRLRKKEKCEGRDEVILRLNDHFPLDIGIFFSLLMNYTVLNPGDCLIMRPNEPHAYLQGDCIECMANSDNVVRAGLTPKLKDIPILSEMLTYKMGDPQQLPPIPLKTVPTDKYDCFVYKSEFREFHCIRIEMPQSFETDDFLSPFPFVGFVLEGNGNVRFGEKDQESKEISEFQQFFIPAKMTFRFSCKKRVIIYLCGSY